MIVRGSSGSLSSRQVKQKKHSPMLTPSFRACFLQSDLRPSHVRIKTTCPSLVALSPYLRKKVEFENVNIRYVCISLCGLFVGFSGECTHRCEMCSSKRQITLSFGNMSVLFCKICPLLFNQCRE